jgi:hypothetical protein
VVAQNLGTVASDSMTVISVISNPTPSRHVRIGSVMAGATKEQIISVVLPQMHHDSIVRDEGFSIFLHAAGDTVFGNHFVQGTFRFIPNYMKLTGPDTVRAEGAYTYTLRVVNRSSNAIHSGTLSGCLAYYACRTSIFVRHPISEIAPHSTATIAVPMRVPDNPELQLPMPAYFILCYGYIGGGECASKPVSFVR